MEVLQRLDHMFGDLNRIATDKGSRRICGVRGWPHGTRPDFCHDGLSRMPRRLKVLMSAYACEPGKGSEPGVGWNWAREMSRWHDVWVLTRANNRPTIEGALQQGDYAGLDWLYFDLPRWARFWKKGARGIQSYYYLWQLAAWRVGARFQRQIGFDLLHHVTFGKYWVPSYLSFLPVKSLLGPLGGGESTPRALAGSFSRRGVWFERKRNLVRTLAGWDPVLRASLRRASLVAATTEESRQVLNRLGAEHVIVEPQCGVTQEELEFFGRFPLRTERPFRLISIGRLLQWKGLHLGLEAFARLQRACPESEYWVVSSGPEAEALKHLVHELGIAPRVTFWGRLPTLADVYDKLAQADVLVHPALHEAFGNVCLEALAAGRPLICLDAGGPSLQATERCGFKARIGSREQAVAEMAEAMAKLYRSPELRMEMGAAARERARTEFHWTRKAERMNALYEQICGTDSA
jgi:glycosyltransferase involved in cell wall biosynthesis